MLLKECKSCGKKLNYSNFYICKGYYRAECKKCHVSKVKSRQKVTKPWTTRDRERSAVEGKQYYQENKERFKAYRARFLKSHPDYYRDYVKKRRSQVNESA